MFNHSVLVKMDFILTMLKIFKTNCLFLFSFLLFSPQSQLIAGGPFQYDSLEHLRKESTTGITINFTHGLSEFTLDKINPETKSFFIEFGAFFKDDAQVAPHVKIMDDFAIATNSNLGKSRDGPVLLGQNIKTKEFCALKPFAGSIDNGGKELEALKLTERIRGTFTDTENTNKYYIALELVDGVTFSNIHQMLKKINTHTKYLIAYNLYKELEQICAKCVVQQDNNFNNFMVNTQDFSVRVVDFGGCDILRGVHPDKISYKYDFNMVHLIDYIFSDRLELNPFYKGNIKNYVQGSFQAFFELLVESGENNGHYALGYFADRLPF